MIASEPPVRKLAQGGEEEPEATLLAGELNGHRSKSANLKARGL
jgi:hypothetical protein